MHQKFHKKKKIWGALTDVGGDGVAAEAVQDGVFKQEPQDHDAGDRTQDHIDDVLQRHPNLNPNNNNNLIRKRKIKI